MKDALVPYGPDAAGTWSDGYVGMGQCQMRFTPEDAFECQPLASSSAGFALVCDARIDNRPELITTFRIPPATAAQLPDSAFVMMAYERWGLDCPLHLNGPFAFALWDAREQQLVLARSPMGEKSLYYHASSKTVAFATIPKGLFALPWIKKSINREYIADYLTLAPPDSGSTFYQDVTRLPAGCSLVITPAGMRTTRYWQFDTAKELRLASDGEYVEAFNVLFDRVISDHLRSSFGTGVMMSGGYDSTAVAAVAATNLQSRGLRLATYTEIPRPGFDGPLIQGRYADETPYVQAMADMYDNLDPQFISSDKGFYLDSVSSFFSAADIPFRNASNRPWYEAILAKAQNDGIRVLLTGASGNLTISWDGKGLLPQLMRNGNFVRAWKETGIGSPLLRMRRLIGTGCLPLLPGSLWRVMQIVRHPSQGFRFRELPWSRYSPIHPEFAQQQRVAERARDKGWNFLFRVQSNTRITRIAMLTMLDSYNTSDYACAYARNFGIDLRDPTGDQRLVEFCLSLPEQQYQRNGKSRWLLQRAMANRLPTVILDNRQRGLQAAGWFESICAARSFVQDEMASLTQSPLASEILDIPRMQKLVDELDTTSSNHANARTMMREYRQIMELGLMTGSFLCWLESGGAD